MALAGAIGHERIALEAEVTSIDQTASEVVIGTRDGRTFKGDAVISTIPFTVLSDVKVTPPWSRGKNRMFKEFDWNHTVKIVIKTKTPSWLDKGVHGWPMAGGDRPWERVIDITGNDPGKHGNLFIYLNGKNADAQLARPRESRAKQLVELLRQDLPDLLDEVLSIQEFSWREQPWIKASFGGPPIGGAWMIREWTAPEGRIHFAGCFTTLKSGWVEGAIESGLRAARQIDPAARPEVGPMIRQEQ